MPVKLPFEVIEEHPSIDVDYLSKMSTEPPGLLSTANVTGLTNSDPSSVGTPAPADKKAGVHEFDKPVPRRSSELSEEAISNDDDSTNESAKPAPNE